MKKEKKNKVGRPEKVGDKKVSKTLSVLPSDVTKAKKYFGNLGNAVQYAIEVKENFQK